MSFAYCRAEWFVGRAGIIALGFECRRMHSGETTAAGAPDPGTLLQNSPSGGAFAVTESFATDKLPQERFSHKAMLAYARCVRTRSGPPEGTIARFDTVVGARGKYRRSLRFFAMPGRAPRLPRQARDPHRGCGCRSALHPADACFRISSEGGMEVTNGYVLPSGVWPNLVAADQLRCPAETMLACLLYQSAAPL